MCAILTYEGDEISQELFTELLSRTSSRGPDMSRIIKVPNGYMGFNRLSIMGLNEEGMQPFELNGNVVVCSGELYGFTALKNYLISLGYKFKSDSDCEIILPLYERLGTKMFSLLDAEFACIIYDKEKNSFVAAGSTITNDVPADSLAIARQRQINKDGWNKK